ncbi:MAG: BON domain-containing protein [Granulosicoccaceae bacterium]
MALTIQKIVIRSLAAVALALSLVACDTVPLDQPVFGGSATSDTPLVAQVQQALKNNPETARLRLKVTSAEDVIILRGTVESDSQSNTAERVAGSVPGVRIVSNHLYASN